MPCDLLHTRLGPVEYRLIGAGPATILFLHGGHSNCRDTLAHRGFDTGHYRLLTPSRPGYGRTPLEAGPSPRETAALFAALLDELKIEKVIVYGVSAGGLTAVELAARHPQRVEKLILTSAVTHRWLDPEGEVYRTARRIFHPRVEGITWVLVRFFARLLPVRLAENFRSEFSSHPDTTVTRSEAAELTAALKRYRSGRGFPNDIDQEIEAGLLEQIECETLILHSRYDQSVPLEHAQYAKERIPQARLEVLDNKWGHMLWIGEGAARVSERVINFIENLEQ